MKPAFATLILLLVALPVAADTTVLITDLQGDISKDPWVGQYWIPRPEVDVLDVSMSIRDDVLDVAVHVVNLSTRSLGPLESMSYTVSWFHVPANGSETWWPDASAIYATHATTETYSYLLNGEDVTGEFDWQASTVHVYVPLSNFASGDLVTKPIVWTHGMVRGGVLIWGIAEVGDRAPNDSYGDATFTIP